MTTSKLFYLIFIFFLGTSISFSQKLSISGKVIEKNTKKPIANVAVFISGTTCGCTTDSLGYFSLKIPFFPCVIVADHVAYESFIKPINSSEELRIEMQPSNFSINEVSVSGKDKRKRNLRFFYSRFIKDNRSKIKVLNDSVLIFERDKMCFKARSKQPLIINNNYLGYRIKVILEEFEVTAQNGPTGERLPLNSSYGGELTKLIGYYLYEPLENFSKEKESYYKNNRRITYYGSYRHFLKAIYNNESALQGYEVEIFPNDMDTAFYEIKSAENLLNEKEYFINADLLKIYYRFDDKKMPIPEDEISERQYFSQHISVIHPTKESFIIRENGTSPNLSFIINGAMSIKSFANSLPEDYLPK